MNQLSPRAVAPGPRPEGSDAALRPGRGGRPRPIGHFLGTVIEKLGLKAGLEDARLFTDWEAAVGPEIARVAHPHRLDGRTLIVRVKHSSWMAELSLRRSELLQRVNQGRGRRVEQILFRLDA